MLALALQTHRQIEGVCLSLGMPVLRSWLDHPLFASEHLILLRRPSGAILAFLRFHPGSETALTRAG